MFGLSEKIFERIKISFTWTGILLITSFSASLVILELERVVHGSRITNLTELYWWWLNTVAGTGSSYGPITPEGRAIATFVIVISYILLGVVISEVSAIIRMIYTRKEEGNIKINYQNHIVIFGYTSLTAGVIKLLKNTFGNNLKIVLVSNDVDFNPFPGLADFINDNPINRNTLLDANVSNALAAIILANDRFRDPDTYSLAIASGIEAENTSVVTISEVIKEESRELFKLTHVDGFLDRRELLKDLLENNPQPKLVRIIAKETKLDNQTPPADVTNELI